MASTSCSGHITVNSGVQAFRDYINHQLGEHFHEGLDVHMKSRQFICRTSLTSYWTADKIREVLTHGGSNLSDEVVLKITSRHVQAFSVLSYIGHPDYIISLVDKDLTDAQLPIPATVLRDFGRPCQDSHSRQAWTLFSEEQWKFSPLVFEMGMHVKKLPVGQILPIRNMTQLPVVTGLQDTKIYKVNLYRCSSRLPANEVVFKCLFQSYSSKLARLHWEREAAVYAKISRAPLPHSSQDTRSGRLLGSPRSTSSSLGVIKSFGSYVWSASGDSQLNDHGSEATNAQGQSKGGHGHRNPVMWTHFTILEYASGGTLAEFCERNATTISSLGWQDQFHFWCQLFNILVGIISVSRLDMWVFVPRIFCYPCQVSKLCVTVVHTATSRAQIYCILERHSLKSKSLASSSPTLA